jgi:hypothetical protein
MKEHLRPTAVGRACETARRDRLGGYARACYHHDNHRLRLEGTG